MSKYAHLMENLAVNSKKSKPYKFDELMTKPVIYFRPATEDNKDYADAMLLLATKKGRDVNRKGKVNALKEVKRTRREDMALFAKYCSTDWEVKDIKGGDVKFSHKECFKFLVALPHRFQDRLRAWLRNSANFIDVKEIEYKDEFDIDDLDELDLDKLDDIIEQESKGEEPDLGKT